MLLLLVDIWGEQKNNTEEEEKRTDVKEGAKCVFEAVRGSGQVVREEREMECEEDAGCVAQPHSEQGKGGNRDGEPRQT